MSRFDGNDGGDPIPPGLWAQAVKTAFTSKHGQEVLREVEAALLTLPNKRLIADALVKEGDVCLVGAYCARKIAQESNCRLALAVKALGRRRGVFSGNVHGGDEWENETDIYDTAAEGQRAGMRWTMAWTMADKNDNEWALLTPEQRYDAALAWVRERIQ